MERAISDLEKQTRRIAILEAAYVLYSARDYADISMQQIAQAAGLAKGTLYLYFKTKESLFLALYEQQLGQWLDVVDQWLSSACTPDTVARFIVQSLQARPHFLRLAAILHPIIEYNIDYETAFDFKARLLQRITQTGTLLERCLAFLDPGQGVRYFLHLNALIIGLQQSTSAAPVVQQVLQHEKLKPFRVDLFEELEFLLRNLLYGLTYRKDT